MAFRWTHLKTFPCDDFILQVQQFSAESCSTRGPRFSWSLVSALAGTPALLSLPRDNRYTHKPLHLWGEIDENKSTLKFHENKMTCLFI